MKASDFHIHHDWRRRVVDLSDYSGAAAWRAAQALAHEGAIAILPDTSGCERAAAFDDLALKRGIAELVLQRSADPRGHIVSSKPEALAHLPQAESVAPTAQAAVSACGPIIERPTLAPIPGDAHTLAAELTAPSAHEAVENDHRDRGDVAASQLGKKAARSGLVTLVGGGPGDPKLLTMAALEAVCHADVILLDRLGVALNVFNLAPGALVIDVGKAPGRHKLSQDDINETMLAFAHAGARVTRLKGGDVFIFGRGGEEWRFLADQGVRVDVVPGITSALSVPAHAGVSATYREVTRAVTIISGHQPFNAAELQALVNLGGTIVILMGVGTFPSTVAGLLAAGLSPHTGVALLEQGYTSHERHTFTTLATALHDARERDVKNPAIIVIGDVVDYREITAQIDDPQA